MVGYAAAPLTHPTNTSARSGRLLDRAVAFLNLLIGEQIGSAVMVHDHTLVQDVRTVGVFVGWVSPSGRNPPDAADGGLRAPQGRGSVAEDRMSGATAPQGCGSVAEGLLQRIHAHGRALRPASATHRDVQVSREAGCRKRPALLLPCRAQHSSFPGQHRMSGATGCAANPPYKY